MQRKTGLVRGAAAMAGLAATGLLCGCGGGGSSPSASSRLAGIWLQKSIAIPKVGAADCGTAGTSGALTSAQGVQYVCAAGAPNVTFFNGDGSYMNYASGTPSGVATLQAQGTWQISGSALRVTLTSPATSPPTMTGTVTFQDVPTTQTGLPGGSPTSSNTVPTSVAGIPLHYFTLTYTSGPYTGFTSTYELSNVQ